MTKKQAIVVCSICIILGAVSHSLLRSDTIEYVNVEKVVEVQPPTLQETINAKAEAIMQTQEFQEEMRNTAMARALYTLSIEQQDKAVALSEMAVQSNQASIALSETWHNNN